MGDARVAEARAAALLRADTALLALLWIGAALAWPRLPEQIPIHFDLAGNPDGWVAHNAGGFVVWMLLPAIATVVSLVMRWAPRLALANPGLWNIPHKREFLALDDEARAPIVAELVAFLASVTLLSTMLLGFMQVAIYLSATGSQLGAGVMVGVIAVFLVVVFAIAMRSSRRAARMIEDAAASPRAT